MTEVAGELLILFGGTFLLFMTFTMVYETCVSCTKKCTNSTRAK